MRCIMNVGFVAYCTFLRCIYTMHVMRTLQWPLEAALTMALADDVVQKHPLCDTSKSSKNPGGCLHSTHFSYPLNSYMLALQHNSIAIHIQIHIARVISFYIMTYAPGSPRIAA